MASPYFVLVNPASGNGAALDLWEKIRGRLQARLGDFEYQLTQGPHEAEAIAQQAVEKGVAVFVVVGGDGTIHETINGFMSSSTASGGADAMPAVAVISTGRGCDFIRTLDVPSDFNEAINRIKDQRKRPIDVGKVTWESAGGAEVQKFFINGSSMGMGGMVARRVQRRPSQLPAKLMYLGATLDAFFKYEPGAFTVTIDGRKVHDESAMNIFICNGRYSGSGMYWAPQAQLDDGLFNVVIAGQMPKIRVLKSLHKFYDGSIQTVEGVHHYTGKSIHIQTSKSAVLELDGETFETVDVKIEALPRAVNFIVR